MRKRLGAIATALLLVFWVEACTSTAAYKAAGTAVTTVDLAMNGWGEWVRAGKANAAQEAEVRKAYESYQQAINIAEKETFAYYASANKDPKALRAIMDAVVQAAVSVIVVVNKYRTGPPIPVPTADDSILRFQIRTGIEARLYGGR